MARDRFRLELISRRLQRLLPIFVWLPSYGREDLRADAIAGVTTAVMLIPQGMGYAMLAGLPPVVGLYAALVPLLAYALFGTSRQLGIGPAALDSMLVAVAVSSVADAGSARYIDAAVTLAAMVGTIQVTLGMLRLGVVANFLSRPVLSGFTSAAALIIGFTQLPHLVALDLEGSHQPHRILVEALVRIGTWHWLTLAIGVANIALLVGLRRYRPRWPRALIAVAATTLASWGLGLDDAGVAIVGTVPSGLPSFALPRPNFALVIALAPGAFAIALVAFVEAITVGQHFARRNRYEIHPNQELIALGIANLGGSASGGYPVASGFARSAVNAAAGARTPMAGVVTACVLALTLSFLTRAFYFMPKAVLAAIIMAAVFGLFDAAEAARLWRVKRADFWVLVFTFVATLTAGIQLGILAGVAASLSLLVGRTRRPHVAVLGRAARGKAYLNVARHPHAKTRPGILVVRMDAQLYFGNIGFLKRTLRDLERRAPEPLRAIVLDASGINQIDSSGEEALREIDADCHERGIVLYFARVKGPVRDVLYRTGFLEKLAQERRIFLRTHEAVRAASGETVQPSLPPGSDPRAPADRIGVGPAPDDADDRG